VNLGIIIQARTGSTRLQNKVLLPFYSDYSVLDIVIERLKKLGHPVVVATTMSKEDDLIVDSAIKLGVDVFRGDEQNVLKRFVDASDKYGFTDAVRICADNPLMNVDGVKELIQRYKSGDFDYYSYKLNNGTPVIKSHLGLFGEMVSVNALRRALKQIKNTVFLEHVTNYLYENPGEFKVGLSPLPNCFNKTESIRFTLDTPEDFALLKEIYEELGEDKSQNWEVLIKFVNERKELLHRMGGEIRKNRK